VIATALVMRSEVAQYLAGAGIRAPLTIPTFVLLPAWFVLLLAQPSGGRRWLADPVLVCGAAFVGGYAIGFGPGIPLTIYTDDEAIETTLWLVRLALGLAAGIGLVVAGVRHVIRRVRQPAAGRRWRAPLLAGAGFALATMPSPHVPDTVGHSTFLSYEVVDSAGLYIAFLLGLAVTVTTGALAATIVRGTRAGIAGSQGGAIAGGVLLAVGGAFIAYASLLLMVATSDDEVLYGTFGQLLHTDWYDSLIDFIYDQPVSYGVVAVFAILLVIVSLGTVRARRRS